LKKRKDIITVAMDSGAAAGAGTAAKSIANHFKLFYLDTGKIYRFIGKLRLRNIKKFNYLLIKKKMKILKMKDLQNKNLLSEDIAISASIIAKDNKIRKLVRNFQIKCAYNPPKKYSGSILDGRDISTVIMKDAMFKFFITADIQTRAKRRYKEYKSLNKKISYNEVLKSIKKRDKSDTQRKFGKLKKTKDSTLINTSKLSKRACFLKIKHIMDRKIKS
jgi:cytidylate kinase